MYRNISSHKNIDLFRSVFKKIIPNISTPTFQEVGWVTHPLIFGEGIRIAHGIALTITKLIDFYSQGILTLLFATVFRTSTHSKTHCTPWEDFKSYRPFVLVYKFFWVRYKEHKVCLTRIPT